MEERRIGDIETFQSFFGRFTYDVVYKIGKNCIESCIFKNLENARIFSELVKLKEIIKQKVGFKSK